jgi:hypothetical protein
MIIIAGALSLIAFLALVLSWYIWLKVIIIKPRNYLKTTKTL